MYDSVNLLWESNGQTYSIIKVLWLLKFVKDYYAQYNRIVKSLPDHTTQHPAAGAQEKDGYHIACHILQSSVDDQGYDHQDCVVGNSHGEPPQKLSLPGALARNKSGCKCD